MLIRDLEIDQLYPECWSYEDELEELFKTSSRNKTVTIELATTILTRPIPITSHSVKTTRYQDTV